MIDLHQRLSEFSYGFGVTRETQALLESIGLKATPFLPSLLHEEELGFDVGFGDPGAIVVLQFKLGQQLSRFRRTYPRQPIPPIDRPFWRYSVDTSEHQFLRMREFEASGVQAYYVAPRFSDWIAYDLAFHNEEVLDRSLLLTPSEIERAAGAAGQHRVVYDRFDRYVCSEPRRVQEVSPDMLAERVGSAARDKNVTLEARLERLIEGAEATPTGVFGQRWERIRTRARSPADAMATIVGFEAWLQGAQLLFAQPA